MTYTWKLPPKRNGHSPDEALKLRREWITSASSDLDIPFERMDIAGVPSVVGSVASPRQTILYFHGGGYRVGCPEMRRDFVSRLAESVAATMVLPAYSLAPEHPFPAAIHEAASVYGELVQGSLPVIVAGDSAGGGLALALAVACRRSDVPMPAGLILISPWADLTNSHATFESRAATDRLFSRAAADEAAEFYLQGAASTDELASPLFADLSDFPPSLIFAGGDEVLLGDALDVIVKLALGGASVESHVVAGTQHTWAADNAISEETRYAFEAMDRFCGRIRSG